MWANQTCYTLRVFLKSGGETGIYTKIHPTNTPPPPEAYYRNFLKWWHGREKSDYYVFRYNTGKIRIKTILRNDISSWEIEVTYQTYKG